ncbi:MAG: hypothetical protein ACFFDB_06450 [Promethearchaeota archaeon]
MKIHTVSTIEMEYIDAVCLDPSVDKKTRKIMDSSMTKRVDWIKEMMKKGLRILVALDKPKEEIIHYKWVGKMLHSDLAVQGLVPMGLLEYLPIDYALEPVNGSDSLFINCMWILPPFWKIGIGKSLIDHLILIAQEYGGISVITYEGVKWFGTSIKYMPADFFKNFGFKEVDKDGERILLYLDLGVKEPPKFILPKSIPHNEKDKITLEIFYNSQCPWSKYMINTIKKELINYPKLEIKLVNTDDRKVIKKTGISRGIRINGKPVIKRMASWEEVKLEIDKFKK